MISGEKALAIENAVASVRTLTRSLASSEAFHYGYKKVMVLTLIESI